MSGLEILGLAASVIQIADIGGRLSVKLFTFTRKVKNADKTIDALSQEIAVTGAVLQQLGKTLSDDKSVKVCSQEAIDTAKKLVLDTEKVFKNLENLLDTKEAPGSTFRKAVGLKRLKFPFLESEIEQVRANLERLKSSLLVILNVLIFAEQLRNRETLPILEDQRELIRTLVAEKDEHELRYERIIKAIADRPSSRDDVQAGNDPLDKGFDATSLNSDALTLINLDDHVVQDPVSPIERTANKVEDPPAVGLPDDLKPHYGKIHHHTHLVEKLLLEIDSLDYKLDHNTRGRLHTGVLDVHWKEWDSHREYFGYHHFEKILADSAEVASHWADKFINERLNDKRQGQEPVKSHVQNSKRNPHRLSRISARISTRKSSEAEDTTSPIWQSNRMFEADAKVKARSRQHQMETILLNPEKTERKSKLSSISNAVVKFEDGLGFHYVLSWRDCHRWDDMKGIIQRAFARSPKFGSHVLEGRFDLFGPHGEVIMPQDWEDYIYPGISVTMRMWPLPDLASQPASPLSSQSAGSSLFDPSDLKRTTFSESERPALSLSLRRPSLSDSPEELHIVFTHEIEADLDARADLIAAYSEEKTESLPEYDIVEIKSVHGEELTLRHPLKVYSKRQMALYQVTFTEFRARFAGVPVERLGDIMRHLGYDVDDRKLNLWCSDNEVERGGYLTFEAYVSFMRRAAREDSSATSDPIVGDECSANDKTYIKKSLGTEAQSTNTINRMTREQEKTLADLEEQYRKSKKSDDDDEQRRASVERLVNEERLLSEKRAEAELAKLQDPAVTAEKLVRLKLMEERPKQKSKQLDLLWDDDTDPGNNTSKPTLPSAAEQVGQSSSAKDFEDAKAEREAFIAEERERGMKSKEYRNEEILEIARRKAEEARKKSESRHPPFQLEKNEGPRRPVDVDSDDEEQSYNVTGPHSRSTTDQRLTTPVDTVEHKGRDRPARTFYRRGPAPQSTSNDTRPRAPWDLHRIKNWSDSDDDDDSDRRRRSTERRRAAQRNHNTVRYRGEEEHQKSYSTFSSTPPLPPPPRPYDEAMTRYPLPPPPPRVSNATTTVPLLPQATQLQVPDSSSYDRKRPPPPSPSASYTLTQILPLHLQYSAPVRAPTPPPLAVPVTGKTSSRSSSSYKDERTRPDLSRTQDATSKPAATGLDEIDALIMRYTNVGREELQGWSAGV